MKKVGEKEQAAVLALPGPERFRYFVKHVVDNEEAWGLWNDGWRAVADVEEGTSFAIWPALAFAQSCQTGAWSLSEPRPIALEHLMTFISQGLREEGGCFAVFPTPELKAPTVRPDQLCAALQKEIDDWY